MSLFRRRSLGVAPGWNTPQAFGPAVLESLDPAVITARSIRLALEVQNDRDDNNRNVELLDVLLDLSADLMRAAPHVRPLFAAPRLTAPG